MNENRNRWTRLEERRPETDATVWVCNVNAGLACYVALYNTYNQTFKEFNPNVRDHPPLAITHWMYLPYPPLEESDKFLDTRKSNG